MSVLSPFRSEIALDLINGVTVFPSPVYENDDVVALGMTGGRRDSIAPCVPLPWDALGDARLQDSKVAWDGELSCSTFGAYLHTSALTLQRHHVKDSMGKLVEVIGGEPSLLCRACVLGLNKAATARQCYGTRSMSKCSPCVGTRMCAQSYVTGCPLTRTPALTDRVYTSTDRSCVHQH